MKAHRNRAWRRHQRQRVLARRRGRTKFHRALRSEGHLSKFNGLPVWAPVYPPIKNWKHLWRRAGKVARARQLGRPYPGREAEFALSLEPGDWSIELNPMESLNVLFLCSRNQWRSPTAENLFRREPGVNARSAGTSPNARRTVSVADLHWAHVVIVMEKKHRQILRAKFGRALLGRDVVVLDIADDYRYMDPKLVSILEEAVPPLLEERRRPSN